MKYIKIQKSDALVDEDSIQDYIDILNSIAWFLEQDGYKEGWRNEIAVNLTVASYMLGLDPHDVLKELMSSNLIKDGDDDEDTVKRIDIVLDYKDRFEWGWMIDADWWSNHGLLGRIDDMYTLKFELA